MISLPDALFHQRHRKLHVIEIPLTVKLAVNYRIDMLLPLHQFGYALLLGIGDKNALSFGNYLFYTAEKLIFGFTIGRIV